METLLEIKEKRSRVNLTESAKGEIRIEVTLEDYNKSNEEIAKDAKDLFEQVKKVCGNKSPTP
jgi:hypothetical protein